MGDLHQNMVDGKVAATYGQEGRTSPLEGKGKAESPMGLDPCTWELVEDRESTERNEIREADRGHSKGLRRPCTGIWIYSTLSGEPSEGCQ